MFFRIDATEEVLREILMLRVIFYNGGFLNNSYALAACC